MSQDQDEVRSPFVGRYVICRCDRSGVHAGRLVAQQGQEVQLADARRLWYWKALGGIALSGVAVFGLAPVSKVDAPTPEHMILDVIEIIPCSPASEASIRDHA